MASELKTEINELVMAYRTAELKALTNEADRLWSKIKAKEAELRETIFQELRFCIAAI